MLSTEYAPGGPRWIDLGSPDVPATEAFYTGLFGWTSESAGPDTGGYGFFNLDGKMIGGYGPLMEPGSSASWTIYFGTNDAETTAKAAEQAGGTVRAPVMDVMTFGRMAQLSDGQNGRFAIWQPKETKGFAVVNVPGSVAWTELHTSDADAARAFYSSVLGWTLTDQSMGDFTYTVASLGSEESAFGGVMPLMPGEPATYWLPYFEVADCDATVAKAVKLGGSVANEAATLAGVGRMAALKDVHGALFSVITSEQPS
jgi:predicted enzyme related to lactoylglutathione lyase